MKANQTEPNRVETLLSNVRQVDLEIQELDKRLESQKGELEQLQEGTDPDNEEVVEKIVRITVQQGLTQNKRSASGRRFVELNKELSAAVSEAEGERVISATEALEAVRAEVSEAISALFPPDYSQKELWSIVDQTSIVQAVAKLAKRVCVVNYRESVDFAETHLSRLAETNDLQNHIRKDMERIGEAMKRLIGSEGLSSGVVALGNAEESSDDFLKIFQSEGWAGSPLNYSVYREALARENPELLREKIAAGLTREQAIDAIHHISQAAKRIGQG